MSEITETELEEPRPRRSINLTDKTVEDLTGVEKAAILLIALGMDAASGVLKHLRDEEVERVSIQIALLRNVSTEVVESVLLEYRDVGLAQDYIAQGGAQFARKTLESALGPHRAEEIMMKVEAAMEVSAFHLLQTVETGQLTNFLQNEHPQTAALILAHLNPRKAADIIANFKPDVQSAIMYRLATMGKTSPELLRDIEEVIRQQIGTLFGAELSMTGGVEAVADILNNISRSAEVAIIEAIRERDHDLAMSIKGLMFVFDDLVHVSDRDLQRILKEVDQKDLALSLKATSEELQQKIFKNMSERAAEMLKEELELMGPVRIRDVEDAQRNITEIAQTLEEQEEISLSHSSKDRLLD
jgi:flagellar motor switch protein FliG